MRRDRVQEKMLHVPSVQLAQGERRGRIRGHWLLTVGTDVVRRLAGYASREGTVGGQVARPQRKDRENHRRRASTQSALTQSSAEYGGTLLSTCGLSS